MKPYALLLLVLVGCADAPKKSVGLDEAFPDSIVIAGMKYIPAIQVVPDSLRSCAHQPCTVYVHDTVWIITDGINVLKTIKPPNQ